ncbi:LacI family DNA-binding transcriptional regulator [Cognatishimia activa]|uniref:LacI family DNA-binding transcriptional regulator n=1 Tax=Cognatishimia activa TaxID=1715691 RepID=UPI002230495D|nr:LacI family DNA-binding transcriptional regulator [Cognatishimia activa]UZD90416.1 LacI family transcriptional regulator [Cognatishimia activa]
MAPKNARIQDVAREAGVSTATVSRALSNPDMLTKTTREAVFDAIEKTGYRVNQAARNLRKQRAGAVLILVPNLGNPFFSQILAGINSVLAESEFSVLIADSSAERQKGKLAEFFMASRVDGMISLDGDLSEEELKRFDQGAGSNKIVFACEWVAHSDYPSVRVDNAMGAQLAVRHLYDLGHRKIAHVTGPECNVLTKERRQGMVTERERLGLETRPEWIIRGDFSVQSGLDAAQRVFAMEDRPTAVFCASDEVAFGLISGLKALSIRVPEDISVVGFDDIDLAQVFVPSLTTIRQDRHRIGARAAEMLLQSLKADSAGPNAQNMGPEVLSVDLVARESTSQAAQGHSPSIRRI